MIVLQKVQQKIKTKLWWMVTVLVLLIVVEVTSLSGPNVCTVKQKYNITKRVKYRAPMSVRTYEWCFSVPPRCSKWNTEMRDVTRLETEERTAEMAVCCPGYKLKDVSCVPICPNGKTGHGCSEDCPSNKWGPNCVHECRQCEHGTCDAASGECRCQDGWQGESCETSMSTTAAIAMMEQSLTTPKPIAFTKTTEQTVPLVTTSRTTDPTTSSTVATVSTTSSPIPSSTPDEITSSKSISTKRVTQPMPTTVPTVFTTEEAQSSTWRSPHTQTVFTLSSNVTLSGSPATQDTYKIITETDYRRRITDNLNFEKNGTEFISRTEMYTPTEMSTATVTEQTSKKMIIPKIQTTTNANILFTGLPTLSTALTSYKENTVTQGPESKKTETTFKLSTTTKFKPKEIWIRPAQKGESPMTETKLKQSQELPLSSKARDLSEATTPKTIIVSIIPTSVSYVTFRKLSLSTAPSISQKNNLLNRKSSNQANTKPIIVQTTATPDAIKKITTNVNSAPSSTTDSLSQYETKRKTNALDTRRPFTTTLSTVQATNSMSSTLYAANKRLNSSSLTPNPLFPTNVTRVPRTYNTPETSTSKILMTTARSISSSTEKLPSEHYTIHKQFVAVKKISTTEKPIESELTEATKGTEILMHKDVEFNETLTNFNTLIVTKNPTKDEETFHILTEPEHITAVMSDKETEKSTMDLISVISIAGGVMMAIITVAVLIVMLDRCKKPRYEEVRKYNDIKMQVMIDNNDTPPPYVRSIFHTPLPDPPMGDKCHYQPISTLDRNLKQFMRPVVVQTISPHMLENFRGILECHYDHLPRRSEDMRTMPTRFSVTPSINDTTELLPRRVHSVTDSDIEALKCEAKLDVIDNTTSEPLYAEIPCWRPPSAHAIEVLSVNGEAVTEL